MTSERLARLHAAAFADSRPWSAGEFAALLAAPETVLAHRPEGFALGRVIGGEAELLTLAVAPEARRKGLGRALLGEFEALARGRGAGRAFLEVAEDNAPARALYRAAGWRESARRPGYYRRRGGGKCDALLLETDLSRQEDPPGSRHFPEKPRL